MCQKQIRPISELKRNVIVIPNSLVTIIDSQEFSPLKEKKRFSGLFHVLLSHRFPLLNDLS